MRFPGSVPHNPRAYCPRNRDSIPTGLLDGHAVSIGIEDVRWIFRHADACVLGSEWRSFNLRVDTGDGYSNEFGNFRCLLDRVLVLWHRFPCLLLGRAFSSALKSTGNHMTE